MMHTDVLPVASGSAAARPAVGARARAEASPSARIRVLGVLYLLVVALGIVAQAFIADRMVVTGDAVRTADNIRDGATLYRLAFSLFIVEMAAQMAVTVLFYDLLKPVGRSVARVGAVLGVVGAGFKMFARVFYYAPLLLLSGAAYLSALAPDQLAALSYVSIRINNQGAALALAFFGFEAVLRGWLIYRSGFLPRFLGVLSIVGGIGWMTFVWPPLGLRIFMLLALFAIAEVVVSTGWYLVRGVDDERWYARAALAAASPWR